MQQALLEREELYQALVDSIPEIVYSRDLDGTVTFIGAKADEVCGVGREQMYRREKTWFEFLHPDDRQRVIDEMQAALAAEPAENHPAKEAAPPDAAAQGGRRDRPGKPEIRTNA